AFGEEGPEALSRRALELDVDRFVPQASMSISLSDDARQHRTGRPIKVADGKVQTDVLATLDRVLCLGDQTAIEHTAEPVVLRGASVNGVIWPRLWLEEQLRKVEPLRFGVFVELVPVQHLALA